MSKMQNFTTAAKGFLILVSLLASIASAVSQEQIQVKPEGDWKGTIDAGGTKLDLGWHGADRSFAGEFQ